MILGEPNAGFIIGQRIAGRVNFRPPGQRFLRAVLDIDALRLALRFWLFRQFQIQCMETRVLVRADGKPKGLLACLRAYSL